MRKAIALLLAAGPAQAGPLFVEEAGFVHEYVGGWEHFVGGGVAVLDCNGDQRPDLVMAGGAEPMTLAVNRSDAGAPLQFETSTLPHTDVTGAWPLDVDGDGKLDLAVLRAGENLLLRGDGSCGFERANEDWGFEGGTRWSTAFSATWLDGAPALAIGNYVDRTDPEGPFGACDANELHRWTGEAFAAEALEPGFCPLSILISDATRSGTPMLRMSNDRHYYVRGGSEQMWTLSAEPRLLTEEDGWQTHLLWGMGIASRDLDGDGTAEVMLTSMGDQRLQINQGGHGWADAPFDRGTASQRPYTGGDGRPSTGWHSEFGDMNNDGRDDLFIAKGNVDQMPGLAHDDPDNLLMQDADGRFVEVGDVAGIASLARGRGGAMVDLNADGLLDLVVINRRAPALVYRNVSTETGNWVHIDVRDAAPNTRAVGGFIELEGPYGTQWREITVGGGHGGGQAVGHHFGIGDLTSTRARLHWPDGTVSPWQELTAGARHRLNR
ncbi:FG-GAP repeat domain-containing protein [Pontivivens insulae]|uniref:ASPIC/UnbV domain-containing protein n=1 Tax=Pontivivens insulae TaxID=1639689 RepID=A0A2R8AFD2_9RHOB|nr:VCBS repeat-containing protein [Pontivivens insulae]RED12151.1 VCBS repeat protein [Pontivivens insulae]SPF30907.1 hypothetical protein POI8812_03252 [Pontivivens insulae]